MWGEGKEYTGLLAHITGLVDHAQGLWWWWSNSVGGHQHGTKDISVPSPERVAFSQHLNQELAKLWPRRAQPFLLCTRGCSDNVIVRIFWGEKIGYSLYWGHPCSRHLASGKYWWTPEWLLMIDDSAVWWIDQVSFVEAKPLSTNGNHHHQTFETCFWCLLPRGCYLVLIHTSATIFMPHKCKFAFPDLFKKAKIHS